MHILWLLWIEQQQVPHRPTEIKLFTALYYNVAKYFIDLFCQIFKISMTFLMLFIKKTFPQDLSILVKPWCLIEISQIFLKIGYFRITVLFNKTWFIISLVFKELSRKFQGSLIGASKNCASFILDQTTLLFS